MNEQQAQSFQSKMNNPWVVSARQKPNWVWKGTLLVGAICFGIPLIMLGLAALLICGITYITLSVLAIPFTKRAKSTPQEDAPLRENVRVIRR